MNEVKGYNIEYTRLQTTGGESRCNPGAGDSIVLHTVDSLSLPVLNRYLPLPPHAI